MQNEMMSLKGFNWDKATNELNTQPESLEYEMPYSDFTEKHYGMPITVKAFASMVKNFTDAVNGNTGARAFFQDILFVEFSKASIFRILSQANCEFIRFYFCIPSGNNKVSLVLEGLQSDLDPVKWDRIEAAVENIAEVGERSNMDPNYEEKGNGGGGATQVRSMLALLLKYKAEKHGINDSVVLKDFMKEYVYGK